MDFWAANQPFFVSAAIIALGYLLKRVGILKASDGEVLARVAFNVTLPATALLMIPKVPIAGANAILPVMPPLASALTIGVGYLVYRNQNRTDRGLSMTASAGFNIGLFAIPLVSGIYGAAGVARFALADAGNIFTIFCVSYYFAYRYSPRRQESRLGVLGIIKLILFNVPFLAYIAGFVMNLVGVQITGLAERVLSVPAAMNRGMGLLVLGTLLRFRFPPGTWRAILPPLLVRYLTGAVAAALVLFLVPIPHGIRVALAGVFVMPAGLTLVPFALKWGYDRDRAAAIVNTGIPASFLLFWVTWALGEYVLG